MAGPSKSKLGFAALTVGGMILFLNPVQASQAGIANADRAFGMSIEVGRLETMVTKAEEVADTFADAATPRQTAGVGGDTTFHNLKIVVLRYNLLIAIACGANRAHPEFCRELYLPRWLAESADYKPAPARMQTMIRDASAAITPFWAGVCATGKSVLMDERFCELE